MSTNGEPQSDSRRRWWYLLLLLVLVILCLVFLAVTGRLPGAGNPTERPATEVDITEVTDQPTEPATETERPTETELPTETQTEPPGGTCLTACDPEKPSCDPKLSCVKDNLGNYVCWGGTDSKGKYCGPTADQKCSCQGTDYVCTLSNGQTTTSPNDARCAASTEQPTCTCKGTDYICTNPDGSVASASYNSTACGGGGQCECRGPDLACPDGTYAQFNPACMAGGKCTCQYSYAAGYVCKETGAPCNP